MKNKHCCRTTPASHYPFANHPPARGEHLEGHFPWDMCGFHWPVSVRCEAPEDSTFHPSATLCSDPPFACLLSDGSFCVPVWTVNTHPLSDSVGLCGQLLSVWQTRVRGQARRKRTKATLCQDSAAAWDPPSLPLLLRCCCWVKLLAARRKEERLSKRRGDMLTESLLILLAV